MKKILITAFIFCNTIIGYCQRPYTLDLGSEGTIVFPDTPKRDYSSDLINYSYQSDSNELFDAHVLDLYRVNPDSLKIDSYTQCNKFADNFIYEPHGRDVHREKI